MILTTYPAVPNIPSTQKIRHGAGIPGYAHRYVGDDVPAAVGAATTMFPDYVGAKHLAGTNGPTVRALPDGRKYLEFDGVNDTLKNTTIEDGKIKTLVMVARARSTDTATTILIAGQHVSINRAGSGTMLNPGTAVMNPTKLDNQWRVVVATATSTAASLTIDGVKAPTTPGGAWGNALYLGANGGPSNFSPLDVVEIVGFPVTLTDAQATTVRAAMRAAYPALLS